MGEAAGKRRAHDALLRAFPWCIYCGSRANSVEHMPPKIMFRGKQRPKGLEFPSCLPCNNGTSHSDLVASTLGRVMPDPATDTDKDEVVKLFRAVSNNIPGLLDEMRMGAAGQKLAKRRMPVPPEGGVLRANGPLVTKHMQIFGAKLGFALYFEAFGTPVPSEGGVQPIWFSNAQAARGEIPQNLLRFLPEPQTLRQGKKEVSDQFQYAWVVTEEGQHALFYATFRESFAIAAIAALDRTTYLDKDATGFPVFSPGDLRNSNVDAFR